MMIRDETADEHGAITTVVGQAFESAPHSSGTEARIVEDLRSRGALTLSLVAEEAGEVVGHIAASPVSVGGETGWYGIGPVSVLPEHQGRGLGSALMNSALDRLTTLDARGAVLVGDPAWYGRFGFAPHPSLSVPGVPEQFVLGLGFKADQPPRGEIVFHGAFGIG